MSVDPCVRDEKSLDLLTKSCSARHAVHGHAPRADAGGILRGYLETDLRHRRQVADDGVRHTRWLVVDVGLVVQGMANQENPGGGRPVLWRLQERRGHLEGYLARLRRRLRGQDDLRVAADCRLLEARSRYVGVCLLRGRVAQLLNKLAEAFERVPENVDRDLASRAGSLVRLHRLVGNVDIVDLRQEDGGSDRWVYEERSVLDELPLDDFGAADQLRYVFPLEPDAGSNTMYYGYDHDANLSG